MRKITKLESLILVLCLTLFWINITLPSKWSSFEKERWENRLVLQMRYVLSDLLWIRMKHLLSLEEMNGISFEESQILPILARAITLLNPHDVRAYSLGIEALWLHLKKKDLAYRLLLEGLAQNRKSASLQLEMGNFQYYVKKNYQNAFTRYHLALRFSNTFSGMALSLAGEKNVEKKSRNAANRQVLSQDEKYILFTEKQVLAIISRLELKP